MTDKEIQIAKIVPRIHYRCPKCNWTFEEDDVEYDEKGPICPNEECGIRLIMPIVETE